MLPSRPHQDLQRNTLQALRRTHGCRKWLKLDLRRTHDAIATPLLQAPTACRRTFGQDPLFQVPASVSGMGMPVPTSPSRQGCRPFSREFSTTLPPGGGHTETHYRGWVCVTKKGSPPKPPGSAPSGPRRGPAGLGRPQRIFAPRSLTGVFSRPLQNCTKGWLIRTLYVQLCVVTFLASSWAYLGPSWVQLAAILSQLKAIEGHLGAMFHSSSAILQLLAAKMRPES